MAECTNFYDAFKANMDALHLPVPTTLFATLQTSIASVTSIMSTLKTLGPDATIAEVAGATTKLEALSAAGSILACAYLGAVIGSLMVATDVATSCKSGRGANTSIAILQWAARHGLSVHPLVMSQMLRHPEVFAPGPYNNYRMKANMALRGVR